ncbi:hypothetical protein PTSG_07194 [Salpingoeca rosetta]|uniref:FYVE-type domain-containing protein n=1 Tax=Salpingoeca rosetta (strain ATCC 50818 / BSB-021) TaxID=946362 RepID=F2UEC0_SALR5|nr:uncharacterized protein PTSG_07194 [Salpingoeca rosetta]EGD74970.1 hypothetical protein PTSG_07194 [Salpingoeca rosetta]|eukprot:XP_004992615.1 hypothetical protein PTSG_07194 [Salpingoeca rosetta]
MAKFGLFNKEDHCRRCGRFVCSKCSSAKVKLAGHEKHVRVCRPCVDILHELETRQQQQQQQSQQQHQQQQPGQDQQQQQQQHLAHRQPPVANVHPPEGPPPQYSEIEHLPRWYRQQVFPEVQEEEVRVAEYPESVPVHADERGLPRWLAAQYEEPQHPQQRDQQHSVHGTEGIAVGGDGGIPATRPSHQQVAGATTSGSQHDDITAALRALSVPTEEPSMPKPTNPNDDVTADTNPAESNSTKRSTDQDTPSTRPNEEGKEDKQRQQEENYSLSTLRAKHAQVFGKQQAVDPHSITPARLAQKYEAIFGADPRKPASRAELMRRFEAVTGRPLYTHAADAAGCRAPSWPQQAEGMSDDELADMLLQEAKDQLSLEADDDDDGDEEDRRLDALARDLVAAEEEKSTHKRGDDDSGDGAGDSDNDNGGGDDDDELDRVLSDLKRQHDAAARDLSPTAIASLLHDAQAMVKEATTEEQSNAVQPEHAHNDNGSVRIREDDDGDADARDSSEDNGVGDDAWGAAVDDGTKEGLYAYMRLHPLMWPFMHPLDMAVVPEIQTAYADTPADMVAIRRKLDAGAYASREELQEDMDKMLDGAVRFHGSTSVFGRYAAQLLQHLHTHYHKHPS